MPDTFTPEQIAQILEEFFKVVGTRQYIGARYVPIFGRKGEDSIEWDNSAPYEPLTIVLYQGNSYTSRQFVPVGVEITNQEFWAITGNYNAQVEMYRRETAAAREIADNALAAANSAQTDIDTLLPKADFSAENTVKKYVDDSVAVVQTDIDTLLPKADFSAENTVKKYVDDSVAGVQADIDTLLPKADFSAQNTVKKYIDDSVTGVQTTVDLLVAKNNYVTPEQFGAIGDGVTDDTNAIQAAVDSGLSVVFTKNYLADSVTISNKTNVNYVALSGSITKLNDGAQFSLETCSNIIFHGFRANGNNVNDAGFIASRSGYNLKNIVVSNCYIDNYTVGVSFNADLAGTIENCVVTNCTITNMRGVDAGFGYGVHFASGVAAPTNCIVTNCYFYNCNRHAVYIARGNGYTISNCRFQSHKKDSVSNNLSACINLSRCWNVLVSNCSVYDNSSCCIRVSSEINSPAEYPLSSYKSDNIVIENCILNENNTYAIVCGWIEPDDGLVGKVIIDKCICDGSLYVGCCENLRVTNSTFMGHSNVSNVAAMTFVNQRGDVPYDAFAYVYNNMLYVNSEYRPIRIASSAAGDRLIFILNHNMTAYDLISAASAPTNISTIQENDGLSGATYKPIKINGAVA